MSPSDHENESANQRPSVLSDVVGVAEKKDSERSSESASVVQQQADAIQGSVADVLGGMEGKVDKGPSERNREDKRGQGSGGTVVQSDDDAQQAAQIKSGLTRALPTQNIMIRKVRSAITRQIKAEKKKVKKLEKMISKGKADEYNSSVARVRRLQEVLRSLAHAAFDKVKEMYFRYFGSDGQKKTVSES